MLYVTLQGYDMKQEVENLLHTFYKRDDIVYIPENQEEELEINESRIDILSVYLDEIEGQFVYTVAFAHDADPSEDIPWSAKSDEAMLDTRENMIKSCKHEIKLAVYDLISEALKRSNPWGILVGMRPVKLVHDMLDKGYSEDIVGLKLRDLYRVSDIKIELALQIAMTERPFIETAKEDPLSLYICIPFCPSKCLYCSFPSNAIDQKQHQVEPYLKALFQEIKDVTQMIRENGQRVDCVYIGGGTPTALSEDQFERLLAHVDAHLDVESLVEYTVEAGRPDSITEAKLKCMKHYGVDRICINPQTMNDETFKVIGRNHDSSAVKAVHAMAKSIGFKTINMDLIVGLPGEDLGSIQATMEEMRRFNPENITLHTLAVKRSSKLNEAKNAIRLTESDQITEMMDDAMAALYNMDMHPYYMYRQKRILANLENVGFSKPGHESIYNMRIMEERHPIVALGAGASSKLIDMQTQKFERQANIKGVEAYIERVDEMIEKKRNYFEHI